MVAASGRPAPAAANRRVIDGIVGTPDRLGSGGSDFIGWREPPVGGGPDEAASGPPRGGPRRAGIHVDCLIQNVYQCMLYNKQII